MAVGRARPSSLLFRLYLSCYNYVAAILCLEMKRGQIYLKTGKHSNSTVSYTVLGKLRHKSSHKL